MIRVELDNSNEVRAMMAQLPNAYQVKIQRAMIKNATAPMLERARLLAPMSQKPHLFKSGGKKYTVIPGTLKKSLGLINMKRARKVTAIVGPRVKGAWSGERSGFYGQFIERGTKTIPKHPFMAPAFALTEKEVIMRYERDALSVFEKAVTKLKAKGKL